MGDSDIIYKIALSMVKKITPEIVTRLMEAGLSPGDFFTLDTQQLSEALGLSRGLGFDRMARDEALFKARKEYGFIEKHNIRCYFLTDPEYPVRLFQIPDAPIILYQLGDTDLDGAHVINVVGTRRPTPYGIDFCSKFIPNLAAYFPDLTVVSGLAFGIDAAAHNAAISAGAPTVACVAHGLNMIYPAQHRGLAKAILQSGGSIVTEYPFGEQPYRQRFLERNRIVAALSDVTVVVESDIKGGAMSTANTAFSYSREVMALPGRISDSSSAGCNHLIRKGKASLLTSAADLIEVAGWEPLGIKIEPQQRNLFPELCGDAKIIYETLRFSADPMQLDHLHMRTMIPIARLMSTLGEMEFDGIIIRHPGNRFSMA